MKTLTKLFSSFTSRSMAITNFHFVMFLLIFCLVVPILCVFVTWFFGKVTRYQFGKALGQTSQMVVGCIGNSIHEMENIIIARIGDHRIRDVHFNTSYCYKHFGYMGNADHNWQSANMFQSIFDIFLGVVPIYITTLLLWGIQCLLGQNNYLPQTSTSLSWSSLWNLKPALSHGFNTAFSTGHVLSDIIYALIILVIASTAFSISSDEFKRTQSGLIFWIPFMMIVGVIIAFCKGINIVLPYLWQFGYFSAFGLGRTIAYLMVIIVTMFAFIVITYFYSDIRKLFTKLTRRRA